MLNVHEFGQGLALHLPWQLTRIEFDVCNQRENRWGDVLAKFAVSLEYLKIRGVRKISPDKGLVVLEVPILPRLRVLQIFRSPSKKKRKDQLTCSHGERRVPGLELKFVTATPDPGSVINYGIQFPSLRSLEVGTESKFDDKIVLTEEFWFESGLSFLLVLSFRHSLWNRVPVPLSVSLLLKFVHKNSWRNLGDKIVTSVLPSSCGEQCIFLAFWSYCRNFMKKLWSHFQTSRIWRDTKTRDWGRN